VRPLLAYAAGELVAAAADTVDSVAAAVELVHAYSLIHDDLPCMDDDALRRGKPSCHVAFGEAMALLAGDALQALAFGVLAEGRLGDPAKACACLAEASGVRGMAGGTGGRPGSVGATLAARRARKHAPHENGALIRASVWLGARVRQDAQRPGSPRRSMLMLPRPGSRSR
jgi:farnesyl diphosphate synthase